MSRKCKRKGCFKKAMIGGLLCLDHHTEQKMKVLTALKQQIEMETKIIFLDTETTGLDARQCGMHQLAGEVMIGRSVVSCFDIQMRPFKDCVIDDVSLGISRTTKRKLNSYSDEKKAYIVFQREIEQHLNHSDVNDKFYLAGWRLPEFDRPFLEAFFDRNAFPSGEEVMKRYFWTNSIDVKTLATQYLLKHRDKIPHFTLEAVASYLGIKVETEKLHTAPYDAYLCRKVYEIVKG